MRTSSFLITLCIATTLCACATGNHDSEDSEALAAAPAAIGSQLTQVPFDDTEDSSLAPGC